MIANKCENEEELREKLGELMAATPEHTFGTCGLPVTSISPLLGELLYWEAEVSPLLLNMLVRTRFQSQKLSCLLGIVIIGFVAARINKPFLLSTHASTTCLIGFLKSKMKWCL